MSSIVKFSKAGLPAVTSLTTALRQMENEVAAVGTAILKMDKTGHWVFGADQTEVEDDSLWAVNPFSFVHHSFRYVQRLLGIHQCWFEWSFF